MNIVKRVIEDPQFLAIFSLKSDVGREVRRSLNEADVRAHHLRSRMRPSELLGPYTSASADVEDARRFANGRDGKMAIEHDQPHIVLKVETVLLVAIVGQEVAIFSVCIEQSAILFHRESICNCFTTTILSVIIDLDRIK